MFQSVDEDLQIQETVKQEREELFMAPLEKCWKQRKFPWKLIVHSMIAILVFTQNVNAFVKDFLPHGRDRLYVNTEGTIEDEVLTINTTLTEVLNTTMKFYEFVKDRPDIFVYVQKDYQSNSTDILPPKMTVHLWNANIRDVGKDPSLSVYPMKTLTYELTPEEPLGIFQNQTRKQTREIFDRLFEFTIEMDFQSLDLSVISPISMGKCIQWKIIKTYSNEVRGGKLEIQFEYEYGDCDNVAVNSRGYFSRWVKPIAWVSLILFLVSFVSLYLNIRHVIGRLRHFIRAALLRSTHLVNTPFYMKLFLNISEITDFVSFWIIPQTIADISNIISSVWICFVPTSSNDRHFFMGLGGLLAVVNLLRYFEYYTKYYLFVKIVQRSLPNVLRFLASIIPFFVGYAILGTLLFGHYCEYFESIEQSMVTLMAALNGDALIEIFNMTFGFNYTLGYLSRFYMFFTLFLFNWIALNILLLIIQDGYFVLAEDVLWKSEDQLDVELNNTIETAVEDETTIEEDCKIIREVLNEALKEVKEPTKYQTKIVKKANQVIDELLENLSEPGYRKHLEKLRGGKGRRDRSVEPPQHRGRDRSVDPPRERTQIQSYKPSYMEDPESHGITYGSFYDSTGDHHVPSAPRKITRGNK